MRELGEARAPRTAFLRQEAFEEEAVGRQARHDERRQHGGRPRNRGDLDPGRQRFLNQLIARIGDERRAGVGDEREPRAVLEARDEMRAHHARIVLVIGDERRGYAVMREQRPRDARVLGDHRIGRREGFQRAEGDVPQIADRRRDEIEAGRDRLPLPRASRRRRR